MFRKYINKLDKVLLDQKRFLLVTILYLFGPKLENELVKMLNISWGTLHSHIDTLARKGYILKRKVITDEGPRTLIELTEKGLIKYRETVDCLRKIISTVS